MPAGRPTKYDPAMCEVGAKVVYGLTDGDGRVFYVGKTVNLKRRMAAYRAGKCHGNRELAARVAEHGVNVVILHHNPRDLTDAEFAEIGSREGLVNLIRNKEQALRYAASAKPWVVGGLTLPTTAYMRHMRNAFGASCEWLKRRLANMSDEERLVAEARFAELFRQTPIGKSCRAWVEAVNASA